MNNLTFGNEKLGYYETICGGAGAGPTWSGRSGIHTHMTNTRITDPEACPFPPLSSVESADTRPRLWSAAILSLWSASACARALEALVRLVSGSYPFLTLLPLPQESIVVEMA